ncbi:MAG: TonB-dependent receptor [Cyclobacteriaceae bacterium]|nr:TonB-dependent receptor [Cyclobacteriaceae bacterium]
MKSYATTIILTLFVYLIGHAQQADTSQVVQLKEVTIQENRLRMTADESNRSLQLISADEITTLPALSLADLLQNVSGVDIRSRGAAGVQADLSIRGSSFDENLVLINGIKLTDPQTGHHLMNLPLSFQDIERIEVLKGAAARVYGQNAYAGAINIITKSPTEKQVVLGSHFGLGGPDSRLSDSTFYDYGLSAGVQLPGKRYEQYLSASSMASNGYQYNSNYDNNNAYYRSSLKFNNHKINLQAGLSLRSFGAGGYYSGREEQEDVKTGLLSLEYEQNTTNSSLLIRGYGRLNKDDYRWNRFHPEWFHNVHRTISMGGETHYTRYSNLGITGIGLEVRNEAINGLTEEQLASNPLLNDDSRTNVGVYVEHHFEKGIFSATPGIYTNYHNDYGWSAFPGIDLGLQLNEQFRLFGSAGSSYRVPTFFDLHYSSAAARIYGDPDLKIGKASTYEIGTKFKSQNIRLEISSFYIDGKNTIDWVHDNQDPNITWQARNFDNIKKYGLESFVGFTYGQKNRLNVSYTYLFSDLEDQRYRSRYAVNNLRHQITLNGQNKVISHFYYSYSLRFFSRPSFADVDILNNTQTFTEYMVADNRLFWEKEGKTIFLEVQNIFNTNYIEVGDVRRPGRWTRMGVRWIIK